MAIVLGLASSQVQVQERKAVCMQESHGLGFGPARAGVEPAFNEESDCVWSLTADHSQAPPPLLSLCLEPAQVAKKARRLPLLGLA